jgi:hypothetical protein
MGRCACGEECYQCTGPPGNGWDNQLGAHLCVACDSPEFVPEESDKVLRRILGEALEPIELETIKHTDIKNFNSLYIIYLKRFQELIEERIQKVQSGEEEN